MNVMDSVVSNKSAEEHAENRAENREELLRQFVGTSADYYLANFAKIGARANFTWTFNKMAALLGPVWFGMRGIWKWGLPFVLLETFALIQIIRGLFGDLGASARERIGQIENTLAFRNQQLEAAIQKNADNIDVFKRAIVSLEQAIADIRLEIAATQANAVWIALFGIAALLLIKAGEGVIANPALESRFSLWLSDRSIRAGLSPLRTSLAVLFVATVFAVSILHFAFPNVAPSLGEFPTDVNIRLTAIKWVEQLFELVRFGGQWLFDLISYGIRVVLDGLEVLFVETPWLVIASFIILLTWLSAGLSGAVASGVFLFYMGLFGFWEKAMTTLALLGTAACISIALGIPLGLFCARRPKLYAIIRPIMDFMQTMPSFVFMIPVIAFFSVGKPAAVITTMIFGGTPVVRLTVLGMRGVPESVREAAIAYGASKWYLLTRVDLPLAAPSILAGVNQTIMLSLAMVVVASLIGAKGLGEDVLEALQYSSVGQGILAGFAILFCAMILNRVIQGQRD